MNGEEYGIMFNDHSLKYMKRRTGKSRISSDFESDNSNTDTEVGTKRGVVLYQ